MTVNVVGCTLKVSGGSSVVTGFTRQLSGGSGLGIADS